MRRTGASPRGLVRELVRSYRFGFVTVILTLVLNVAALGYLLLGTQARLSSYVEMTRLARESYETMLKQEVSLRGWLATGDQRFLKTYAAGNPATERDLRALLDKAKGHGAATRAVVAMMLSRERWTQWAESAATTRFAGEHTDDRLTAFLSDGNQFFTAYERADLAAIELFKGQRTEAMADQRAAMQVFLAGYVAMAAAAGYVTWRRRRRLGTAFLEPMDRLLATIGALHRGDLTARTRQSGVEEIDAVGSELNGLAAALELANAEARVREQRLTFLADRFETVVRVGREIGSSLSVRYVSSTVSQAAAELVGAPTTLWVCVDQQIHAAHRSEDPDGALPPPDLEPPEVVTTAASQARQEVRAGAVAYPLVLGGRVVGVLEAQTDSVDVDAEQVLSALLATAATALESAQLHTAVKELADLDGLTHLPNRRRFEADLDSEWQRCRRYGRPLSLIMFDLDHFKRLNDTHGHLVGDAVLRNVADGIVAVLRTTDTAYRYGGEELSVLLRETAVPEATVVAERIRAAIEATADRNGGVQVTASLGVAELATHMTDRDNLVREADAALYAAKREGRNRVVTSSPPLLAPIHPDATDQ